MYTQYSTVLRGETVNKIRENLLSHSIWVSISQYSLMGFNFLSQLIYTRLLSSTDFGIYGLAISITEITRSMFALSFNISYIVFDGEQVRLFNTAFFLAALQNVVFIVIFLIIYAVFIKLNIYKPRVLNLSLYYMIVSIFASFNYLFFAYFDKRRDFKQTIFPIFFSGVLAFLGGLFVAIKWRNYYALLIRDLISSITLLFILGFLIFYKEKNKINPRFFDFKIALKMLKYGFNMILARFSEVLFFRLDMLLLGKIYTSNKIGYYERGKYIANMFFTLLNPISTRLTLPVYSAFKFEREKNKKMVKVLSLYLLIPTLLFASIIVFFPEFVISLLYGTKWISLKPILLFFLIYITASPIFQNLKQYLYAMERVAMVTYIRLFQIVLFTLSFFFIGRILNNYLHASALSLGIATLFAIIPEMLSFTKTHQREREY